MNSRQSLDQTKSSMDPLLSAQQKHTPISLILRFLSVCALTFTIHTVCLAGIPAPLDSWQKIIRQSPYWISQGTFDNLATIREWVLAGNAYCETPERHILFDRQARFLGYFSNPAEADQTQALINAYRAQLATNQKVAHWVPGSSDSIGYPFAVSCDQPYANLQDSFDRYSGKIENARLWGTWDGMTIGSPSQMVSLHQALQEVYDDRKRLNRISLPQDILATLAGKILIESGARPKAHSSANAKGIMQLSPQALKDCNLATKFHFHRMAQIDCAFKLLEQNHRLLEEPFAQVYANIPQEKQQALYSMLLIQAYHGGIGRVSGLLTDPELNKPALYFSQHHKNFSPEDMALGMIYHNLGRNQFGFASLYYVVDVGIAKKFVCQRKQSLSGC